MLYSDEDRIPGIYNFCDRWCERCSFTARCEVFAREAAYNLDESLDPMGDALNIVAESFAEAKEMLIEHAEEMGIDLKEAMNDPEVDATIERTRENTESQPAVELAKGYAPETRHILEKSDEWTVDPEEDPQIIEALEVIRYYLFSVAVKVHSCYHAVLDIDGCEDPDEISDTRSYANGTAKVTLMLIDRSIASWNYLRSETNDLLLDPIIARLETIKQALEEKFPNARDFIRPGFDEIETEM
jgi:type III secretion system FlhB-like substrate exporter